MSFELNKNVIKSVGKKLNEFCVGDLLYYLGETYDLSTELSDSRVNIKTDINTVYNFSYKESYAYDDEEEIYFMLVNSAHSVVLKNDYE